MHIHMEITSWTDINNRLCGLSFRMATSRAGYRRNIESSRDLRRIHKQLYRSTESTDFYDLLQRYVWVHRRHGPGLWRRLHCQSGVPELADLPLSYIWVVFKGSLHFLSVKSLKGCGVSSQFATHGWIWGDSRASVHAKGLERDSNFIQQTK